MSTSNIEAAIAAAKAEYKSEYQGHVDSAAQHELAAEAAKKAAEGVKTPSDSVLRQTVTFDAAQSAGNKADAAAQQAKLAVAKSNESTNTTWITAFAIIIAIIAFAFLVDHKMSSSLDKFAKAQADASATSEDSFASLQQSADQNSADIQLLKGDSAFIRDNMVTKSQFEAAMAKFAANGCTQQCTPKEKKIVAAVKKQSKRKQKVTRSAGRKKVTRYVSPKKQKRTVPPQNLTSTDKYCAWGGKALSVSAYKVDTESNLVAAWVSYGTKTSEKFLMKKCKAKKQNKSNNGDADASAAESSAAESARSANDPMSSDDTDTDTNGRSTNDTESST